MHECNNGAVGQSLANVSLHTVPSAKRLRESSLELLRIVAMMLVLLIHYVPTRDIPTPQSVNEHFLDTFINLELRSISFVCVNCFILISGYFGIKWRLKSFGNLIFQILFWLAVGVVIGFLLKPENEIGLVSSCFGYVSARWFVSAYICLYIMAPVLNAFIENSTKRKLGYYLLLFYSFSTIFGYLILSKEFNEGMSMISLIGIYLTGAFLRKYSLPITGLKAWQDFLIYMCLGLVLLFCNIIVLKLGINKSLYGYLNPLVILSSVYLFLFFKKLNIGYVPIVNFVAVSSFAVYLFHMHPLIYGKYQELCCRINQFNYWTPVFILGFFISIFFFCVIVDRLRILMFDILWFVGGKLIKKPINIS